MTKYLTFCTDLPAAAYKHLALQVPRGTLSASELQGDEAECLSDGMVRAAAKKNGSQVDPFLCPTLTLYLEKHGEVGGGLG